MKKLWIAFMAVMLISAGANAQIRDKKATIKEEKIKFINDYCKFTDEESKKFWELEDEMQAKLKEVRKSMRRELKDIKDRGVDNVSESELKKAFDNRKSYEQKLVDIKWEYNDKFITTVGVKKTAKFYEGEIAFRKKLLDRLRDLQLDGNGEEEEDKDH
jgi:hypothetical protein